MEQTVGANLQESRTKICKECPIFSAKDEGLCNRNLFLNPKTNDVSTSKKRGYFQGCGCKILKKVQLKSEKCPAGKW